MSFILLFLLIIPLVFIFVLLLPIIAIIDIVRNDFNGNDKLLMALIVIFIPFGAIIYFLVAPSRKINKSRF